MLARKIGREEKSSPLLNEIEDGYHEKQRKRRKETQDQSIEGANKKAKRMKLTG